MNKNTLEFFVKMKDMMSGGLNKIAQTAKSTSQKVQAEASKMGASLTGAYQSATNAVSKYIGSLKSAKNAQDNLSKTGGGAGSGLLAMGGKLLGGLAIGAMLVGGVKQAIGGAMQVEKDKTGLTTFLGKAGADAAYANIRKDAAATPYDTASLLMVNRSLISAGLSAEEARKDTMNLANAISAVGGGNDELSRMAANLQQIKTVGKATAMDIRQFGMTGINIYEMLSRATGKSIDQVKEMDVSYEMLSKGLAQAAAQGGMYFGALDAMSKTTEGRWNTFKDTLANTFADFGTRLLPFVNTGLDIANSWLEKIVGWFQGISFSTGEWSAFLQPVQQVLTTVWSVVKSVAGFVWNVLSGLIEWIKKSELMRDIFSAIGWAVGKVGDVVIWVIDKLKWLWDNVLKPILDGVELLYSATKNLFTHGAVKVTQETKTTSVGAIAATSTGDNTLGALQKSALAGKVGSGTGDVAREVASGGPRTINISGVKFTDKIEIHSTTIEGGVDDLENKLMNMFARVLQSSADIK